MTERKPCAQCPANIEYCYLKKAEDIATESKESNDPKELIKNAWETHKKISALRKKARENLCPMVNDDRMDPNYPGRDKL